MQSIKPSRFSIKYYYIGKIASVRYLVHRTKTCNLYSFCNFAINIEALSLINIETNSFFNKDNPKNECMCIFNLNEPVSNVSVQMKAKVQSSGVDCNRRVATVPVLNVDKKRPLYSPIA